MTTVQYLFGIVLACGLAIIIPASAEAGRDCPLAGTEDCDRPNKETSEAALKRVYTQLATLYGQFDSEYAAVLAQSREAWLHHRDAECRLDTIERRPSPTFEIYWFVCINEMNRERIARLQKLVSGTPPVTKTEKATAVQQEKSVE